MPTDEPGAQSGRPTMRDVAALAGVALKTVSRVINDVPTVDPALAQRVQMAAEKLGYRRNFAASILRNGRTNTIGLLLDDVSNPFSASIHRAIEDFARERDVLVITASLDEDPRRERELVGRLIDRRVDGLIIVPAADDHRYVVAEQRRGTSFVFVDRAPEPLVADAVVTDNRRAAERAVAGLLRAGRRRIAYLGDEQAKPTAAQRFQGYQDALAAASVGPMNGMHRHGLRTVGDAQRATTELLALKRPPDALFTSQNLVTIGAVQALHELGQQHSVALVGFDDVTFADRLNPGVSVVAQNIREIGRVAAERLFDRISGDRSPARLHTVDSRLIVRGSGELPLLPAGFTPDE